MIKKYITIKIYADGTKRRSSSLLLFTSGDFGR